MGDHAIFTRPGSGAETLRKEVEGMKTSDTSIHEPSNNDYWIVGHGTVYHWVSWGRLQPCYGDRFILAIGPDTF